LADLKISQLSDGGASQATDEYVVARSGSNFRIDGASVAAAATSVGTLTSLTVTGDTTLNTGASNNLAVVGSTPVFLQRAVVPSFAGQGAPGLDWRFYTTGTTYTTGAKIQGVAGDVWSSTSAPTDLVFSTVPSASTTLVERMRIAASGAVTIPGDLTVDTSTLKVDSANNRVGIGTASPSDKLEVVFGTNGYITATNSTDTNTGVKMSNTGRSYGIFTDGGSGASNSLRFFDFTASAERLRLDASGNLGLGVTPSAWSIYDKAIQIANNGASISSWVTDYTGAGYLFLNNNAYSDGTNWKYFAARGTAQYRMNNGVHSWHNAPSGTAGNAISFTQAMTLDASGNLGVGSAATTPLGRVDIASGIRSGTLSGLVLGADVDSATARSSNTRKVGMLASPSYGTPSSAQTFLLAADNQSTDNFIYIGGAYSGYNAATQIVFYTGATTTTATGTERARITSGGYFKASNTGTYAGSTGTYHELRTDASDPMYVWNGNGSPNGIYLNFPSAAPDNNTQYFLLCNDQTTARCYIWSDGDLANHDGVYGTISDERLKQDIIDAGSQWDDIKAIRFRKYRMKTDVAADPNAPAMLGVVAQELEQTSPGLVDEHPEYETRDVPVLDEDGNETGEVTTEKVQVGTTKTVKSSILLMKAAVALQEAMARIEALEAEVAALKANA